MNKSLKKNIVLKQNKLAIIGLGYVGLPLAIEFAKKRKVVGFDINKDRINQLKKGIDKSREISFSDFKKVKNINFTYNIDDIKDCTIFIVTIPTPLDKKNKPNLNLLKNCCGMLGSIIKKKDLIIFESTVYPGVTEEVCALIIQKKSGLIFNKDFFCGYSPERINPGDKKNPVSKIIKITSGSTPEIAIKIDNLYKEVILAGTHMAPSIKVAEAAKVVENTQRDVNIALMNEFSIILDKLNIDTKLVLDAARTKWNFLSFKPGLVGGHCISVDPYYLAHKSIEAKYFPQMIFTGRKINENMAYHVAEQLKKFMIERNINLQKVNILIMGFTFKENCSDIRNTKIIDLIKGIKKFNENIDVYDPWANKKDVKNDYGLNLINQPIKGKYSAIVFAVAHDSFAKYTKNKIRSLVKNNHIIYDLKYMFKIKNKYKSL